MISLADVHKDKLEATRCTGGSCSTCNSSVTDTGGELRCKAKSLKVVKHYNLCSHFSRNENGIEIK